MAANSTRESGGSLAGAEFATLSNGQHKTNASSLNSASLMAAPEAAAVALHSARTGV
jgi:hypothetical protein